MDKFQALNSIKKSLHELEEIKILEAKYNSSTYLSYRGFERFKLDYSREFDLLNLRVRSFIRNTEIRIKNIFNEDVYILNIKPYFKEILADGWYRRNSAREEIKSLLNTYLIEVDEIWTSSMDERVASDKAKLSQQILLQTNNNIFVVHGHDHGRLQTVARFLEKLKLAPVILHEQPNSGNTLIEKFEINADVSYAVVLLTPDDVGAAVLNKDKLQSRARQNVILELGYFIGKLGRKRTVALVSQGVEIPSDYSGIVYISFDGDEWKMNLARELRNAGFTIDMNDVI